MRIIFMGSSAMACPSLAAIARAGRDEVVGVVTQPDRPKGRSLRLAQCPARECAASLGLRVITPENVNAPASVEALRGMEPDAIVVVAYGQILKPAVLSMPPRGCVNAHASLLPKYRGAAPYQWAIARGETVTGVTVMFMNERMDAGDILCRREEPISAVDTGGSLHDRLAGVAAGILLEALDAIRAGAATRTPQDESAATYAPKLSKADGRIDWTSPARDLYNKIRGFNPWPCCSCEAPRGSGSVVRVLESAVADGPADGAPGTVTDTRDGLAVATGDGVLRLVTLQPEGKRPMPASAFVCGHRLKPGDVLG